MSDLPEEVKKAMRDNQSSRDKEMRQLAINAREGFAAYQEAVLEAASIYARLGKSGDQAKEALDKLIESDIGKEKKLRRK